MTEENEERFKENTVVLILMEKMMEKVGQEVGKKFKIQKEVTPMSTLSKKDAGRGRKTQSSGKEAEDREELDFKLWADFPRNRPWYCSTLDCLSHLLVFFESSSETLSVYKTASSLDGSPTKETPLNSNINETYNNNNNSNNNNKILATVVD